MFTLPRGLGISTDVPLASAAWEAPAAVERLAYAGGASLFVGAIPASETWPVLADLYERGGAALSAVEASRLPPLERAERVNALESLWRAAQFADCVPLGLDDDRHFVTIAGSRSGKGTSAIIPNLCLYPGSVVCLDPKGENATLTAARRGGGAEGCEGMGQPVFVLDPFGVADVPDELRAGLNPLALLDPDSPSVVNDAELLAEGLVVSTDPRDAHWDESARNFIKGLILHLVATMDNPSLFTLRRFLTQGDYQGWDDAMVEWEDAGKDARDFAAGHARGLGIGLALAFSLAGMLGARLLLALSLLGFLRSVDRHVLPGGLGSFARAKLGLFLPLLPDPLPFGPQLLGPLRIELGFLVVAAGLLAVGAADDTAHASKALAGDHHVVARPQTVGQTAHRQFHQRRSQFRPAHSGLDPARVRLCVGVIAARPSSGPPSLRSGRRRCGPPPSALCLPEGRHGRGPNQGRRR
ncbi:type IV secretory system conjugative DNA transfer family protein [Magnetospirillum sp. 15-1]|uniref:type IV secretory system conjugative DNA transfer family protein n=1 Tax=Magnetospirillum sp. 15-1 TaxID=1979370 RepID=UPI000BBCE829|nr:type IV secretory system conjugative DNA transfer family protein [Magnetospirillum sp. 15-1]